MKTGILTFHRVYNYGAVLQAYSIQKILDDMGIENEMIDFSIPKQLDLTGLYSTKNGLKRFLKTLSFFPFHHERKERIKKFDRFFDCILKLSEKRYLSEEELKETDRLYDRFLVGSDQIWNVDKKAESSNGYFLDFAEKSKCRVSYAPSIGTATYDRLLCKRGSLLKFDHISCREEGGAKILSDILGKKVPVVLDPTLLVDTKHLIDISKRYDVKKDGGYILYYSLDGYDKKDRNMDILKVLASKFKFRILFVTPEWPRHDVGLEVIDAGPEEFLGLIDDADLVCTNSFHGTALSIKLNTPFFVLEEKKAKDERKRSILKQMNLMDRIISSVEDSKKIDSYEIDFLAVDQRLRRLQEESYRYLIDAMN